MVLNSTAHKRKSIQRITPCFNTHSLSWPGTAYLIKVFSSPTQGPSAFRRRISQRLFFGPYGGDDHFIIHEILDKKVMYGLEAARKLQKEGLNNTMRNGAVDDCDGHIEV